MAIGDIYSVSFNCSSNNRAWSFGCHALEESNSSDPDDAGVLSRACSTHFESTLKAILGDNSFFESVEAYKVWPSPVLSGYTPIADGLGTAGSDEMSNDNALVIQLRQDQGAAKFNGTIFLAGQIQGNHSQNVWNGPYLTGAVKAFADQFAVSVPADSPESGSWKLAVLSKKFVPPATAEGTALEIVSAVASNRVFSQRRRKQRVQGFRN